ncbi:NAD(P)H-binding protein [Mycobacterium kyorinense]|uniref:NAD(P)H-binding protein n=1 Tax=Mycobacterium kyorinense TaxID=487514 RepID=UPI003B027928
MRRAGRCDGRSDQQHNSRHDDRRVARFLTFTSGVIAPQPYDQLWWHKHILGPALATILRPVDAEHQAIEKLCTTSGLDWTIFRPARLTDGKLTGSYPTAADIGLRGGTSISRADSRRPCSQLSLTRWRSSELSASHTEH